ncbi:hypothetical protein [Nonomuraea aurantiaca]|uniref:hypothetical protein n=1 Tax=Nonomuraea aurantiaca TaxID=2878562 RepID=UPI001CD97E4C|nr:hypothetical protein [Nonomuraea aurantiaca]MCA2230303.1 hypothetical protein [Nonomuraea aurantiaca]
MTSTDIPTSSGPAIGPNATVKVTGGIPLTGRMPVQGSKNIAVHLYAAALLADDPLVLADAPDILDTDVCAHPHRDRGPGSSGRTSGAKGALPHPGRGWITRVALTRRRLR